MGTVSRENSGKFEDLGAFAADEAVKTETEAPEQAPPLAKTVGLVARRSLSDIAKRLPSPPPSPRSTSPANTPPASPKVQRQQQKRAELQGEAKDLADHAKATAEKMRAPEGRLKKLKCINHLLNGDYRTKNLRKNSSTSLLPSSSSSDEEGVRSRSGSLAENESHDAYQMAVDHRLEKLHSEIGRLREVDLKLQSDYGKALQSAHPSKKKQVTETFRDAQINNKARIEELEQEVRTLESDREKTRSPEGYQKAAKQIIDQKKLASEISASEREVGSHQQTISQAKEEASWIIRNANILTNPAASIEQGNLPERPPAAAGPRAMQKYEACIAEMAAHAALKGSVVEIGGSTNGVFKIVLNERELFVFKPQSGSVEQENEENRDAFPKGMGIIRDYLVATGPFSNRGATLCELGDKGFGLLMPHDENLGSLQDLSHDLDLEKMASTAVLSGLEKADQAAYIDFMGASEGADKGNAAAQKYIDEKYPLGSEQRTKFEEISRNIEAELNKMKAKRDIAAGKGVRVGEDLMGFITGERVSSECRMNIVVGDLMNVSGDANRGNFLVKMLGNGTFTLVPIDQEESKPGALHFVANPPAWEDFPEANRPLEGAAKERVLNVDSFAEMDRQQGVLEEKGVQSPHFTKALTIDAANCLFVQHMVRQGKTPKEIFNARTQENSTFVKMMTEAIDQYGGEITPENQRLILTAFQQKLSEIAQ